MEEEAVGGSGGGGEVEVEEVEEIPRPLLRQVQVLQRVEGIEDAS